MELTDLVHKGEKQGIFTSKMPASIQQVVREENLCFMKNRDVYDIDYFRFVKKLVTKASVSAPALFNLIKRCFIILWTYFEYHVEMATVSDNFLLIFQSQVSNEHYTEICLQAIQLGVHFLFNTYFRTKKKLRWVPLSLWLSILDKMTSCNVV